MQHKSFKAFTIIELLVVVSLIGVISGVLITVLNPTKQRDKARDGVIISNVNQISQGIQAYYEAEGSYPADNTGNPLTGSNDALAAIYIKTWPSDATYTYALSNDKKSFVVHAPLATDSRLSAKYYSAWSSVKLCKSVGADSNCI